MMTLRVQCFVCGKRWWLEFDPPACECADGGIWEADSAWRESIVEAD